MYLQSGRKEECSGCTACKTVCPKKCISMVVDEEGFSYPIINKEECISCGRCQSVCPFNKVINNAQCLNCYYGWMKNEDARFMSTSGGAFFAIAEAMIKNGLSHIYGAAYDNNLEVHHLEVTDANDLDVLRRSKYVQSEIGDVFNEISEQLKNGEKVLFSGTPCQVQGLINILNEKMRANLYTVSLVCHGVSSPMVLKKYLNELSQKYHCKISKIVFRDKQIINGTLSHKCTTLKFSDGNEIKSTEDPYTMSFGIGLMTRPCCFNCPFSTPNRETDVTIGDFWGIEDIYPELSKSISKGISLLLTHTQKGEQIIDSIRSTFEIGEGNVNWALNPRQQQLLHPVKKHVHRDKFMNRMVNGEGFIKNAKKEILGYKIKRSVSVRLNRVRSVLSKGR